MLSIEVESTMGSDIIDAIREMLVFSVNNEVVTWQKINGVIVQVFPHSEPDKVYAAYSRAQGLGRTHAFVR